MIKDLKLHKLVSSKRYFINKKKTALILATSIFAGILTGCNDASNIHLSPPILRRKDTFIAKIYDDIDSDDYTISIVGCADVTNVSGLYSAALGDEGPSNHKHYYDFINKKYYTSNDYCMIEDSQLEHKQLIMVYDYLFEYLKGRDKEKFLENKITDEDLKNICSKVSKKESKVKSKNK